MKRFIVLVSLLVSALLLFAVPVFGAEKGNTAGDRTVQQDCIPDCDPPCEPDQLRIRDRGESCIPDPICTAEVPGVPDKEQDQPKDQTQDQLRLKDQTCK